MLTAKQLTKAGGHYTNKRSPVLSGAFVSPHQDTQAANLKEYFNMLTTARKRLNIRAEDVVANQDFTIHKVNYNPYDLGLPQIIKTYIETDPDRDDVTLKAARKALFDGGSRLRPDDAIVVNLGYVPHFRSEYIVTSGEDALENFLSTKAAKELLSKHQVKRLKTGISKHIKGEDAWVLSTFNLGLGTLRGRGSLHLLLEWEQALFYQTE